MDNIEKFSQNEIPPADSVQPSEAYFEAWWSKRYSKTQSIFNKKEDYQALKKKYPGWDEVSFFLASTRIARRKHIYFALYKKGYSLDFVEFVVNLCAPGFDVENPLSAMRQRRINKQFRPKNFVSLSKRFQRWIDDGKKIASELLGEVKWYSALDPSYKKIREKLQLLTQLINISDYIFQMREQYLEEQKNEHPVSKRFGKFLRGKDTKSKDNINLMCHLLRSHFQDLGTEPILFNIYKVVVTVFYPWELADNSPLRKDLQKFYQSQSKSNLITFPIPSDIKRKIESHISMIFTKQKSFAEEVARYYEDCKREGFSSVVIENI